MAQDPFEAIKRIEDQHAANEQRLIANEMARLTERPDRFAEAKRLAHLALAREVPGGDIFGYETGRDALIWFNLRTAVGNFFAEKGMPDEEPYATVEEFQKEHAEIGEWLTLSRPAFINTFAAAQQGRRDEKQWFGTTLSPKEILPLERKHSVITLQRSMDDFIDNRAVATDDFRGVYITGIVSDQGRALFYELSRERQEHQIFYSLAKHDAHNLTVDYEDRIPPLEVHSLTVLADNIFLNGRALDDLYKDRALNPTTLGILKMADQLDELAD